MCSGRMGGVCLECLPVNCIFSWGTGASQSSERAIMYLSASLLCHSGIPKTQIGNQILASSSPVTLCQLRHPPELLFRSPVRWERLYLLTVYEYEG